jgi:hypothetical protein
MTTYQGYLAPAYRDEPLAAEWDAYLAEHCDWSADEFGGGYAWATSVPPRERWEAEVWAFNEHLAAVSPASN